MNLKLHDIMWEKIGEGLANLESLKHFKVNIEDTDAGVTTPWDLGDCRIYGRECPLT